MRAPAVVTFCFGSTAMSDEAKLSMKSEMIFVFKMEDDRKENDAAFG